MVGKVWKGFFSQEFCPIKQILCMTAARFHGLNRFRFKRCHKVRIERRGVFGLSPDYRTATQGRGIRPKLDRIRIDDKIDVSTSLVKTAVLLGLVASLVGGVATSPVAVKADASVKVTVQAKASVKFGSGKANAEPKRPKKTAVKSKTVAEKTTNAGIAKGKGTMRKTSINVNKKNGWKKASSLAGE